MTSFLDGRESVSAATTNLVRPASAASSFLPLIGGSGAKPAQSASAPASNGSLQPFGATPAMAAPAAHRHGAAEARVETVVVDGVVQKIIVHCGCGEQIEIHCGY